MLKKLLKYDLKWCYKPLIVFYILAIFFSIVTRIVESFEQTLIVLIIDKICSGIVIAMIINIVINCFMRNWARFVKNIYKDESYIMSIFNNLEVSSNALKSMMVVGILVYAIYNFGIYFIGNKLLNKGVNVD